jgi:hypothetical protein
MAEWMSNHFNYANFDHSQETFFYLSLASPGLILAHNQESVTLCHTIQHFLTLFLILPLTVDIYTLGGQIYFTLCHTIEHYDRL